MKKILLSLAMIAMLAVPAFATGTGGITVEYPTLQAGYTANDWTFQPFLGTPALFSLALANLQTSDQTVATVANTLNGTSTVTLTSITGKSVAVLNHATTYRLRPLQATSFFPSIWIKGTDVNPATGADAPTTYLSGTDANKFYQTGLTIQAPYWDAANYQWTVYVYADKDVLTGTTGAATGTILDPRLSTMRWIAWADDNNGRPKNMWGIKASAAAPTTMFNTLPLCSGGTPAQVKAFLIGTTGASLPPNPAQIPGVAEASIPGTNTLCYNIDRNIPASGNANGMAITDRSNVGLVYAAPNDATCHRTENLHIQFQAIWPTGVGISAGTKSCDISIYQRTTL